MADVSLPPVGQTGRLHVAGKSVPVEVVDHAGESLTLELIEEGWSLTDGEARLVCSGDEGTDLIAGSLRVLRGGELRFTPGRLTGGPPAGGRAGDGAGGDELVDRRGRGWTPDIGHGRATYRVDMIVDVVVVVDGRELKAQTLNVSPTGCLLRGDVRPLTDTIVLVRLPLDERKLQLTAQVIRVDGERYALHFRDMDATQERKLSQLLAKRQREILRRR